MRAAEVAALRGLPGASAGCPSSSVSVHRRMGRTKPSRASCGLPRIVSLRGATRAWSLRPGPPARCRCSPRAPRPRVEPAVWSPPRAPPASRANPWAPLSLGLFLVRAVVETARAGVPPRMGGLGGGGGEGSTCLSWGPVLIGRNIVASFPLLEGRGRGGLSRCRCSGRSMGEHTKRAGERVKTRAPRPPAAVDGRGVFVERDFWWSRESSRPCRISRRLSRGPEACIPATRERVSGVVSAMASATIMTSRRHGERSSRALYFRSRSSGPAVRHSGPALSSAEPCSFSNPSTPHGEESARAPRAL